MKKVYFLLLIACAGTALLYWKSDWMTFSKKKQARYRTVVVEKRDMINSVSAIGALSAVITVEVGTEVSGQIKDLLVDFNSPVHAGQIIARIDPRSYQTLLRQAEAELAISKARLETKKVEIIRYQAEIENAEANLAAARAQAKKAQASYDNAQQNFDRQKALSQRGLVAKNDFDRVVTSLNEAAAQVEQYRAQVRAAGSRVASAKADEAIARASIREVEAQIQLGMAALDKRRIDLDNTIIRSPVNGVVIDRRVDVGQTVAASLQAPTLFTIAQDLRKMQVSTYVDEADIGRIRPEQTARFTVDAYGARRYVGSVTQIRKMGKSLQNVVTYEVIISADNPDLTLMPGMTADVEIILVRKPGVLAVANAALRFTPQATNGATGDSPVATEGSSLTPGGAIARGGESGGQANFEERIRRYTERLNLSTAQADQLREKLQQIRQKTRSAYLSLGQTSPRAASGLREKARKEARAAILGILNADQRELFEALIAENRSRQGTLWHLTDDGLLAPVRVNLGVSDATHTEVSGDRVREGLVVVTGME
ncbi:MAG: HlyD family efflux transporter periplasmic adaptor subunit [Deltaproteobacteria bacterium]|nr:HlyD family efflux transporter periplasmic adaptor subunit [Deltaproteobacteria bacterium]